MLVRFVVVLRILVIWVISGSIFVMLTILLICSGEFVNVLIGAYDVHDSFDL